MSDGFSHCCAIDGIILNLHFGDGLHLEELGKIENHGNEDKPGHVTPEVLLGEYFRVLQLAQVANAYIALKTHKNSAIDRGHHGNLNDRKEEWQGKWIDPGPEPGPHARQSVQHHATTDHHKIVHGHNLE